MQHFGNRKARHIAGHLRLAHARCGDACEVAALVVTRIHGGHIGAGFVTGDRLEFHVRKIFGHLECGLHITKAGGKDQLVALQRQITDDALGVRAFRHIFNKAGFDLRAQRSLHRLPAVFMLTHPTGVGHGRDIHKANFQRRRGRRRRL